MQKWEYKSVMLCTMEHRGQPVVPVMNKKGTGKPYPTLGDVLLQLGDQGWELVSAMVQPGGTQHPI